MMALAVERLNPPRYTWDEWDHDEYSTLDRIAEEWKTEVSLRIWNKIKRGPVGECWTYSGALNSNGYAVTSIRQRQVYVHRFTYELKHGPIPEGHQVDHLCRNTACVNPWHLEAVTPKENTLRGTSASARNHRKTHCPAGHPYDLFNTAWHGSARLCRACQNARHRTPEFREHKQRMRREGRWK